MGVSYYVDLYKLWRRRLRSKDDYKEFQRFLASQLVDYLESHGANLRGKLLFDCGSHTGAYSKFFTEAGAEVVGLDYDPKMVRLANRTEKAEKTHYIIGDALKPPLNKGSFDLVIACSLIEHIRQQQDFLETCYGLLKPGGKMYLSFPPWYSVVAGHKTKPFHLFLPERAAIRISRIFDKRIPENARSYRELGLYRTTIGDGVRMAEDAGFKVMAIGGRYQPSPIFTAISHVSVLREFLILHVQLLLAKPLTA